MDEGQLMSLTMGTAAEKSQLQRAKETELERIAYPFREPDRIHPAERGDTGEFD
jgi:hypothetical protein